MIDCYYFCLESCIKNIIHYKEPTTFKKIVEIAKHLNINLKDDEVIEFLGNNYKASIQEIEDLKTSKIFFVEEELCILLNNTSNKIIKKQLPFNNFFIECKLEFLDCTIYGLHIIQDNYGTIIKLFFNPKIELPIKITYQHAIIPLFDTFDYNQFDDYQKFYRDIPFFKQHINEIKLFVINFLDFINQPDVQLITVERTKENNEKRIEKGKLPIPPINYIRINGDLKIYMNKLNSGGHFSYSHKFWVRGHFRTLRNPKRYGDKVGTKIWILPFIKGSGILLEKCYEVTE